MLETIYSIILFFNNQYITGVCNLIALISVTAVPIILNHYKRKEAKGVIAFEKELKDKITKGEPYEIFYMFKNKIEESKQS